MMIGLILLMYASIAAMIALIIIVLTGLALSFIGVSPLVIGGVVGGISALALALAFVFICTTGLFDIAKGESKKLTLREIIPLSMFCVMSVPIGTGLVDVSPILASTLIEVYLFFHYIEMYDILTPIEITTVDSPDAIAAIAIAAPILSLMAVFGICIVWEYISEKIGKILPKGKPKSHQEEVTIIGVDASVAKS